MAIEIPNSSGQNLVIASRIVSRVHLPRSISTPLKFVIVVPFTSFATNAINSSVSVIKS